LNHHDHVNLLRAGVTEGGVWADLGSGSGAFTLALADLLGPSGEIYSLDLDANALATQTQAIRERFPTNRVHYRTCDFTGSLELPPLDGVVMANSLHYVPDDRKQVVVSRIRTYLKPEGRLVLVEYNVDRGNPWVPYPLSYGKWASLAGRCGFKVTRLLATCPSSWLQEIYSALSY
jgi:ubiquinone/menaquinone biosynthesis C-methylase UbiE